MPQVEIKQSSCLPAARAALRGVRHSCSRHSRRRRPVRHSLDRLVTLRSRFDGLGLDAWLVPRADEHQGEYVPPSAERLRWLTGFSGSAGLAVVGRARRRPCSSTAAIRVQARQQVDTATLRHPPGARGQAVGLADRDAAARCQWSASTPGCIRSARSSSARPIWRAKGIKLKPVRAQPGRSRSGAPSGRRRRLARVTPAPAEASPAGRRTTRSPTCRSSLPRPARTRRC